MALLKSACFVASPKLVQHQQFALGDESIASQCPILLVRHFRMLIEPLLRPPSLLKHERLTIFYSSVCAAVATARLSYSLLCDSPCRLPGVWSRFDWNLNCSVEYLPDRSFVRKRGAEYRFRSSQISEEWKWILFKLRADDVYLWRDTPHGGFEHNRDTTVPWSFDSPGARYVGRK